MTSTSRTLCPAGEWTEVITNNDIVRMQPSPRQNYSVWVDSDPPADDAIGITPDQPGGYFELSGLGGGVSVYIKPAGAVDVTMTVIAT